jgi:flagellar hook-basal body complex protein FliE
MALPILPTNLSIPPITLPVLPSTQTAPGGGAFQSAFADAVSKVEGFQQNAQTSLNNFLAGEGEELHHVAIATQQAELSFQLFMQVRNKIVAAYQQVMQMQV